MYTVKCENQVAESWLHIIHLYDLGRETKIVGKGSPTHAVFGRHLDKEWILGLEHFLPRDTEPT